VGNGAWLGILVLFSVLFIVVSTTRFKLHPFLALLSVTFLFGLLSGMDLPKLLDSLQKGFGDTLGRIGIVIVCGLIIGAFLEKSGGAFSLAEAVLNMIGRKRVPLAMAIMGHLVSIAVFADSGFVILLPLAKALSRRARLSLAVSAVALFFGLLSTHVMVPPTPGPLGAAEIMGADVGLVILYGLPVSFLMALVGCLFAVKIASRVWIEAGAGVTEDEIERLVAQAPRAWKAAVPLILPILLIVTKSFADYPTHPFGTGPVAALLSFIGSPVVALSIGVLLALWLPKRLERSMLSSTGWVGESLNSAAIVILVTGAGGAFGRVLMDAGIGDAVGHSLSRLSLGLWLPFLVAAALRLAQGSATVAMLTTSAITLPLVEVLGLASPEAKALTVLAIASGAAAASHANDSGFWIVTQLSGMDVRTGYRLVTVGSTVVGLCGAVTVWLVGWFVL